MAKFKGDYYAIDKDDREIGGDLTTINTFADWRTATKAWEQTPEPESGCVWFVRLNDNDKSCEAISCKGPDRDPLYDAWIALMQEMADVGKIKISKKSTRH